MYAFIPYIWIYEIYMDPYLRHTISSRSYNLFCLVREPEIEPHRKCPVYNTVLLTAAFMLYIGSLDSLVLYNYGFTPFDHAPICPPPNRWRRQWQPTPVLLPGKSHGRRSLVSYSPWGREELDSTEQLHFHFHALEKKMETHSSIVAWRIPGTGAWWAVIYGVSQSQT